MAKDEKPELVETMRDARQDSSRTATKDQTMLRQIVNLNEQTQELKKSINTFVTGQGAQNPFLQNNPFSQKSQAQAQTQAPTQPAVDTETSKK